MAPLPQSAKKAGEVIDLPKTALNPQNTPDVVTDLRLSELRNARGARSCKAAYNKALQLYGKGK